MLTSYVYDFEGKAPDSVLVPHVALNIRSEITKKTFNTVILLDTGAYSDITFNNKLKRVISEQLSATVDLEGMSYKPKTPPEQLELRYRVGPISATDVTGVSTKCETGVTKMVEGRLISEQSLSIGSRGDGGTTLSLKICQKAGKCAIIGTNPVAKIEDYFEGSTGTQPAVYSPDVEFQDGLGGFEHYLKCAAKKIDPHVPTYLVDPPQMGILLPKNPYLPKAMTPCWDTGAAVTTVPKSFFTSQPNLFGKITGEKTGKVWEMWVKTEGGVLLRFLNVRVDTDYDQCVIGASVLNLFRIGFDPSGDRIGLDFREPNRWKREVLLFKSETNLQSL